MAFCSKEITSNTLLFVANVNCRQDSGYANKIYAQRSGFEKLGFRVLVVSRNAKLPSVNINRLFLRFYLSIVEGRFALFIRATCVLLKNSNLKYIYIRYPRSDPALWIFLLIVRMINSKIISASEIPTFPYDSEFEKNLMGRFSKFLDCMFSMHCARLISKYVVIGYSGAVFGRETIKINNGVGKFPKHHPSDLKSRLVLIGVGNVSARHGYDRILYGIAESRSEAFDALFNIVGTGPEIPNLKKLSVDLGISDKVRFLGQLHGKELDAIFNQSHVAVGNLAFHRINVSETSALKEREYCARGVPFIMSAKDESLADVEKLIMKVANNNDPIKIRDCFDYVKNFHGIGGSDLLQVFASKQLSWESQLSKIFVGCQ